MRQWVIDLKARTVPEIFSAIAAGNSSWRFFRGLNALSAHDALRIGEARGAQTPDDELERREAELIAQKLHEHTRETIIQLYQTAAGCDWLALRWQILLNEVKDNDCAFNSRRVLGVALLGKKPSDVHEDPDLYEFNRLFLGTLLGCTDLKLEHIMNLYDENLPESIKGYRGDEFETRIDRIVKHHLPPSCAEAARLQRAFYGEQIAALRQRAERLRRQRARAAALRTEGAVLAGSVEQARCERQVASYYRMVQAATADVRRLRHERLRGARDEPDGTGPGVPEPEVDAEHAGPENPAAADAPAPPDGEAMAAKPPRGATPDAAARREEPDPPALDRPPAPLAAEPQAPASGGGEEPVERPPAATGSPLNAQRSAEAAPPRDPERPGGLVGGVLPPLLLLLLLPLGGPGRETALEPHRNRGALLDVVAPAPGAWGRRPQGKAPEARPPRPAPAGASPAPGRLSPSHPGRRASLRSPHRHRVRRPSLGAWDRRPRGQTPDARTSQPAAAGAAQGRLERRVGRVPTRRDEAHRQRPGLRWASRRVAAFDPPYVCRYEPENGASRVVAGSSSFGIVKASRIGLRPRDSPGLRGPPQGRP
jgi:hypothetical protein